MGRGWIGVIGGALVLLTACGGGGEGTGEADTAGVSGTDNGSEVVTEATGPGAAGVTAPSDTFLPADIPLPVGDECGELYDSVMGAFAGIGSSAADETFSGFAEAFDRLRELVPAELTDDLEVMSATYARIDAALARYDYDFARLSADPEAQAELAAAFADEDGSFAEATAQLERWFDEQCSSG